jgi:hypothetical protein
MPAVDFTKAELLADMEGLVNRVVYKVVRQEIDPLRREFESFQAAVAESFDELTSQMNEQFDEVHREFRSIRRVLRQHSADIAELKSAMHYH